MNLTPVSLAIARFVGLTHLTPDYLRQSGTLRAYLANGGPFRYLGR